jgi:NAD(P)-dependent dehydrogenase (short-subunit alcohol dehydrogenase family)
MFVDKIYLVRPHHLGMSLPTKNNKVIRRELLSRAHRTLRRPPVPLRRPINHLATVRSKGDQIRCDVSDDAQVEAVVKETVATLGHLNAAYNNAVIQNVLVEMADHPRDDYDRVMAVNLRVVWSCMKFELQQLRKQGSGAIVNCSSLGGRIGGAQRATYHAAKHGVIGVTKSAALEYATRCIRVNDVCPGMIRTPMFDKMIEEGQGEELDKMPKTLVPMGPMGKTEKIADVVLWLCSSAASYVTGQSILVDGGYVMR